MVLVMSSLKEPKEVLSEFQEVHPSRRRRVELDLLVVVGSLGASE